MRLLLSITERDAAGSMDRLTEESAPELAEAYRCAGLTMAIVRRATTEDVAASGSTWAKRLGIPERRDAWLFETFVAGPSGRAGILSEAKESPGAPRG